MLHGRYVVRLRDLPYIDNDGRAMPVEYAISVHRYRCADCRAGIIEPLPSALRPIETNARITRRLSQWLVQKIQTNASYDAIASMKGYSRIWLRKWAKEIRQTLDLPPKPVLSGPKQGRKRTKS